MIKRKARNVISIFIIIFIVCFMFGNINNGYCQQFNIPDKCSECTFEFYAGYLNNILFPKITKYIDAHQELVGKDFQKIGNYILDIILKDCITNNIMITMEPDVKIRQFSEGPFLCYTVDLSIAVFDSQTSNKNFLTSMKFFKRFILYFKDSRLLGTKK